ncbi:MAG: FAD-dependent oxidoreductase [Paracoccaceae bacterium]|nr:FAD-dependent oxidoreductase [Paracoccaceae bacterium]MDE2912268.1 FAD-dependent oxidoreductase [Paracoccaceae bacterium]
MTFPSTGKASGTGSPSMPLSENQSWNRHWDVAVVGGGVFGLACGLACVRGGLATAVFESHRIGSGASGGPLGAMTPFSPVPWSPRKQFQFEALVTAERYWAEVDAVSGIDSGYGRVGRWVPLADRQAFERAQAHVAEVGRFWGSTFDLTLRSKASPRIAPGSARFGVMHDTLSSRIRPADACRSLARTARFAGVDVFEGHRVTGIERGAISTEPRPDGVRADTIILAAGADSFRWLSPEVASEGLTGGGVKGQAALVDCNLGMTPVIQSGGLFIVSHSDATVGVGSTREVDWSNPTETDGQLDSVIDAAAAICPELIGAPVVRRWAGLRPRADGANPLLGLVPNRPGLLVATGGYGIGFGIAHVAGDIVAAHILGRTVSLPDGFHTMVG